MKFFRSSRETIRGIDEVKKLTITISDFKVIEVKDAEDGKKDVRIEFAHEESPEEGRYKKRSISGHFT